MIRTVSEVLDLKFRRIQFTPDLMPSDITGTDILEVDEATGRKEYRFIKGPIFTNILLADEINRTPPKTQAALLEAMQEHRVTAAGETYPLDLPFFVLATQNPLEQEGTYPLPEAQLDRFMFSIYIDYPSEADEETIAKVTTRRREVELKKVLERHRNPRIAAGGARSSHLRSRREIRDPARALHASRRSARAGIHQEMDPLRRRPPCHAIPCYRRESARRDRREAAG